MEKIIPHILKELLRESDLAHNAMNATIKRLNAEIQRLSIDLEDYRRTNELMGKQMKRLRDRIEELEDPSNHFPNPLD